MEIQDKIFEKIKKASQKEETKSFDAMENVWARVEEKLDHKEDRKIIPIWRNIGIAASILLVSTLGYQFLKSDNQVIANGEKTTIAKKQNELPATVTDKDSKKESENSAGLPSKVESNYETEVISHDDFISSELKTDNQSEGKILPSPTPEINPNKPKLSENDLKYFDKITVNSVKVKATNDRTVIGVVKDATGPIPGASIVVKGTNKGVVTDLNGNFKIETKKGEELVVSSIGYKTEEKRVSDEENIDVVLNEDSHALSEVVVTGYVGEGKSNKSNSVISIRGLNSLPNPTPAPQILQGKVAGVVVQPKASKRKAKKEFDKNLIADRDDTWGNNEKSSTEEYDQIIENQFETPKAAPLSTFSIDVDNASYTNVRRFINNGQKVPKDAVRVEEMVNFFKYNYPQPVDGQPFSINTDYSNCPWNANHQLLRIGLQGKIIPTETLPASNFVFLIDVSGSMDEENKLPLLKQSMKILANELRKEDKVSIVVYAGAAGLVLKPTKGDDKKTIINSLDKLSAGGSTAGGEGIVLAYKIAEENFIKGGNNRVIIATDGDFNVGITAKGDVQDLIEDKRQSGVFLTCLGFGMGNYKDVTLETLADKGNGNYAYIDNIQEANRFLGKEFKGSMFAIAKDVKIQIEFNPSQVAAYRLIGYENRKLKAEDFKNDKIDAGELGSGHTVTAFYEIIPVGAESEYIQPDLKYTKPDIKQASLSNELATVKFRYKKPDGNKSIEIVKVIDNKAVAIQNSPADFKFSAAVAWLGLKLRDSKLISEKGADDIKKLARGGLINDTDGYKTEFIRLVENVK